MPKKRLWLFLSFVVLSFVLMTYQSKSGVLAPLRFLTHPINALNNTIHSIISSIKEPFRNIALRDEENRRLREELNKLLLEQQRYRDAVIENIRLRELLSLKEKEQRYVTAARVIAKGNDRWSNTLVIDKGRRDGLGKDMAVITVRGLVGKVSSLSDSYSSVLLINDINFSAAVRLEESRKEGIISGTGSRNCILKYIPHEDDVKQGEAVVTSGLDSLFPPDIPVGFVSKITKKGTSLLQDIEVIPFQDTTRLEEVVIVRR